jgi:hypothetical protein
MIKRRYDKETGELGKAYPETMDIPEPYLTLSNEENDKISVDDENVYFYIDNKLTKKNKQEIEKTKARIAEIKQELEALDLKSIRAIRSGDSEYIEKYEQQAEALRKELAELN